jgi:hypothetical protein
MEPHLSVSQKHKSSLTQGLCEDESSSSMIRDISQCFYGSNSAIKLVCSN